MPSEAGQTPRQLSAWSTWSRTVGIVAVGLLVWAFARGFALSVWHLAWGGEGGTPAWVLVTVVPPFFAAFVFCALRGRVVRWQYGIYFGLGLGVLTVLILLRYYDGLLSAFLFVAVQAVLGGLGGQAARIAELAFYGPDGAKVRRVKMRHIAIAVAVMVVVAGLLTYALRSDVG